MVCGTSCVKQTANGLSAPNKVALLRKNFDTRKTNFFHLPISLVFRVFFMRSPILSLESRLHFETKITLHTQETFFAEAPMDHLITRKQLQKVFGSL